MTTPAACERGSIPGEPDRGRRYPPGERDRGRYPPDMRGRAAVSSPRGLE